MKNYAGLDVSMKETFICVIDETGKKLHENSVKSCPKAIFDYFLSLTIDFELIGLESGSMSHWLTTGLQDLGLPVKCIDARHVAAIMSMNINKTDRNDAKGIADAMRCGLFKEVRAKAREEIALSTLLNSRKQLVDQRVELLGSIRGLLKPYGISLGSIGKSLSCLGRIKGHLEEIPEIAKEAIERLLEVLEILITSIKGFDQQVRQRVRISKNAQLLMSIPGIGPVTSLRFLAEICDASRFNRSKSVGAYVGMTPRQYSSGELHKQGRISKCGPKELRSLLMEAGVVILTRTRSWSKLKAWGLRIQKKHGLKKAATAVGRKLSVIMHHMLVTGESFRFSDVEKLEKAA